MFSVLSFAENRTVSWDAVTTYTDGTSIESANRPVRYTIYWSYDNNLTTSSLHTIISNTTLNSAVFDPNIQGMTSGVPIYFTAKATIQNGAESALSPPYKWIATKAPTDIHIF